MCSRDWVRTWMVTSSGMRPRSMSARTNSNSVSEAAGNPTSISLKPARTSVSKNSTFSSRPMGTISAWLPSRRSTEHQMGARSMWSRRAQRMGGFSGAKYWIPYLLAFCMLFSFPAQSREAGEKKSPRLLRVQETKASLRGTTLVGTSIPCPAPCFAHRQRCANARPWVTAGLRPNLVALGIAVQQAAQGRVRACGPCRLAPRGGSLRRGGHALLPCQSI